MEDETPEAKTIGDWLKAQDELTGHIEGCDKCLKGAQGLCFRAARLSERVLNLPLPEAVPVRYWIRNAKLALRTGNNMVLVSCGPEVLGVLQALTNLRRQVAQLTGCGDYCRVCGGERAFEPCSCDRSL